MHPVHCCGASLSRMILVLLHGVDPGANQGDALLVNSVLGNRGHGIGSKCAHTFPHHASLFAAGFYEAWGSNSDVSSYGGDIDHTHVSFVGIDAKIER